jgi:uncharacterized protein
MGLILRSSAIHAVGCYTTAPIAKGTRVVEYTGPRLPASACENLYAADEVTYLFGMQDGNTVIDGHGTAAFVNHSCDPNCETEEMDGHVWIVALRDIAPGEELTYDYNLYDGDDLDDAPCSCGARKCRGTMYEPAEIKRLNKLARTKKKPAVRAKRKKPHRRAA